MEDKYLQRGVSSSKEDVHNAVKKLDKGLFPNAFCKIMNTPFESDKYMVLHADGAGTKSSLAYAYWKETGDLSVWSGIATDAIVMNTDDMLCTGIFNDFFISSTIGRNKGLITSEVISAIIEGNNSFAKKMKKYGVNISLAGGETADVGDLVRSIIVDATALGFVPKENLISNDKIAAGNVIVAFASYGQAEWENTYNSGIGSNGLTSARHDIFNKSVSEKYPESFDFAINDYAYQGKYALTDPSPVAGIDMGKFVLSPTRTYLPLICKIFPKYAKHVNGMIHCTGGGQMKVFNYINNLCVVKNDFLPVPPLFDVIQKMSGTNHEEMYRTFNMGHRLELYVNPSVANDLVSIAKDLGVDAKIIGYCEDFNGRKVELDTPFGVFVKEERK